MTQRSIAVFASPCGTWNSPPSGYAIAWTPAVPDIAKAMPAVRLP